MRTHQVMVHAEHDPKGLMLQELLRYQIQKQETIVSLDSFKFLVDKVYGCIAGKVNYKTSKCYWPLSKNLTPTDEAFCLLVLENSYDKWTGTEPDTRIPGKYTSKGTNRKNQGWHDEGIVQFNELVEKVKESRKDDGQKKEEEKICLELLQKLEKTRGMVGALAGRKQKGGNNEDLDEDEEKLWVAMDEMDVKEI